jgi:2-amino-4-hydroxy-6-hydroxymethyldihydropteridine diphosphokinase
MPAFLALGTNIGDRLQNLNEACERLKCAQVKIVARSKIYETQSVEGGGPDDFFNACLRVETAFSPRELLRHTQNVEIAMGRPHPPRSGPRRIDIDVLLYDDLHINEPDLQIPHPRMATRAFVLRPLLDVLEGGWVKESEQQW